MENVPELLRSDEYAEFRSGPRARLQRRRPDPERRRLRRPAAAPARDRGRHPRLDRPGRSDARRPGRLPLGRRPWRTFRDAVEGLPLKPNGEAWHVGRNPRPESIRRYKAVPRDGGDRFQMQRNLDRAGSATWSRPAGGTSRPAPPTSSAGSGGTDRRSRSAPSSTSPRRAATCTRARTGRSRSARPRAA